MYPNNILLPRMVDFLADQNTARTVTLRDLEKGGFDVFNFEYPYFSLAQKTRFEKAFSIHYALREIGFETPARFRHQLKAKLWDIMPYYVQLYGSELDHLLKKYDPENTFNPLHNVYERTKLDEKRGNVSNVKTEGQDSTLSKHSDTPDSGLESLDNYLSDLAETQGTSKSGTDSKSDHTYNTDNVRYGNIGTMTYGTLIKGYREVFLNIDLEIIEKCNDLFMGIY